MRFRMRKVMDMMNGCLQWDKLETERLPSMSDLDIDQQKMCQYKCSQILRHYQNFFIASSTLMCKAVKYCAPERKAYVPYRLTVRW